VVFAGSVPKGLSSNTYELLISYFNNLGVCTVLDASGELFVNGIKGKPHSIKPNLYELSMYAGKKIASIEDALPVIDEILNLGVQEVLLTLGKNGSLYVSKNKKYQVLPLTVTSKNTVGAGDSFLAGYVYALEQKKDVVERMKLASAVATSSVLSETTGPNNISQIDEFISQIEIIEI